MGVLPVHAFPHAEWKGRLNVDALATTVYDKVNLQLLTLQFHASIRFPEIHNANVNIATAYTQLVVKDVIMICPGSCWRSPSRMLRKPTSS